MSFPGGDARLRGFLLRPPGPGPFPAVVWNHGSEREPGSQDELARFYVSAGYVFLIPHRQGHGESPGAYPLDSPAAGERREVVAEVLALHGRYLQDTVSAVRWLRERPFVDEARMAMSGVSHGGIQTLLAAEADAGMKAYVPFAPGAMAWRGNPEIGERLLRAVRNATSPIFLLQARNDFNLGPSEVLGGELERRGEPNRVRVYPPYGQTAESGHGEFACRGTDVWGSDVLEFLARTLG